MSILVSTVENPPSILLVGETSLLKEELRVFFSKNKLNVVVCTPQEILDQKQNKTQGFDKFYKIIWSLDFTKQDFNKAFDLMEFFQKINESVVIIGSVISKININDLGLSNIDLEVSNQERLLREMLGLRFPTQLILGLDILDQNTDIPYPLKIFFERIGDGILLDPEQKIFFQTIKSFVEAIRIELLKSDKQNHFLIRGHAIKSSTIVSIIQDSYEKYFNISLQIRSVLSELDNNWKNFVVVNNKSLNILKILDKKIRSLPHPELRLKKTIKNNTPFRKNIGSLKEKKENSLAASLNSVILGSLNDDKPSVLSSFSNHMSRSFKNSIKINKNKLVDGEKIKKNDEKIEKELNSIFGEDRVGHKKERKDKRTRVSEKIIKKSKHKTILFFMGLIMLFFGTLGLVFFGLFKTNTYLAKNELIILMENSGKNRLWCNVLKAQVNIYQKFLGEDALSEQMSMISGFDSLVDFNNILNEINTKNIVIYRSLFQNNSNINKELEEKKELEQSLYTSLLDLEENLNKLLQQNLSTQQEVQINKFLESFEEKKKTASTVIRINDLLPSLLALNQDQTYLVVLQNNLILRPSGGVIEAAVLINLKRGFVQNTQAINVDEINTALFGVATPPLEIKEFLGEDNWLFKDSAWEPNFLESSQTIGWFVEESTSQPINGVLAINYNTIKNWLGAVGPIKLDNYNEVVNESNLLDRVEFYELNKSSRTNKQAGSFSEALLHALINKLKTLDDSQILGFENALMVSLDNKESLFSFIKQSNEVLGELDWGGDVLSPSCPAVLQNNNCLVDTIYQVDSNVGQNLVNKYIQRKIVQKINLLPEKIQHKRTVYYYNSSKTKNSSQGKYKNYIRFLLPNTAEEIGVEINNEVLPTGKLKIALVGEKKEVGFYLEIDGGSMTTVELKYGLKQMVGESYSYVFFNQKQPGTSNEVFETYINVNDSSPSIIAPQAEIQNGVVGFSTNNSTHSIFGIRF